MKTYYKYFLLSTCILLTGCTTGYNQAMPNSGSSEKDHSMNEIQQSVLSEATTFDSIPESKLPKTDTLDYSKVMVWEFDLNQDGTADKIYNCPQFIIDESYESDISNEDTIGFNKIWALSNSETWNYGGAVTGFDFYKSNDGYCIVTHEPTINGSGEILVTVEIIENEFVDGVNWLFDTTDNALYVMMGTQTPAEKYEPILNYDKITAFERFGWELLESFYFTKESSHSLDTQEEIDELELYLNS